MPPVGAAMYTDIDDNSDYSSDEGVSDREYVDAIATMYSGDRSAGRMHHRAESEDDGFFDEEEERAEVSCVKCHFLTIMTIVMRQFEDMCHNSMH